MRLSVSMLTLVILVPFQGLWAQSQPAESSPVPGQSAAVASLRVEDGGVRSMLESIVVPPKANAPFSLVLHTEWVRSLSDGGTLTLVNQRRIARDSEGRIYQERWLLVPKNGKEESRMNAIQIYDPTRHTLTTCWMLNGKNECTVNDYRSSPDTVFTFQGPPPGPLPDGRGESVHENLGTQFVAGVETTGTRDTQIYNAGVFGNERKMSVEREFWFAPSLGFNLLSKRSDPRIGTQTFTATDLILSEPDPKLFQLPQGFTAVDHRENAVPAN